MEREKRKRPLVNYYEGSDDEDDAPPPIASCFAFATVPRPPPIGGKRKQRNSGEDDDEGYEPPEEEEDEEDDDDEGDDEDEGDYDIARGLLNAQVGNHGYSVAKLCEKLYGISCDVKKLQRGLRLLRNGRYIQVIRHRHRLLANAPVCELYTPCEWLAEWLADEIPDVDVADVRAFVEHQIDARDKEKLAKMASYGIDKIVESNHQSVKPRLGPTGEWGQEMQTLAVVAVLAVSPSHIVFNNTRAETKAEQAFQVMLEKGLVDDKLCLFARVNKHLHQCATEAMRDLPLITRFRNQLCRSNIEVAVAMLMGLSLLANPEVNKGIWRWYTQLRPETPKRDRTLKTHIGCFGLRNGRRRQVDMTIELGYQGKLFTAVSAGAVYHIHDTLQGDTTQDMARNMLGELEDPLRLCNRSFDDQKRKEATELSEEVSRAMECLIKEGNDCWGIFINGVEINGVKYSKDMYLDDGDHVAFFLKESAAYRNSVLISELIGNSGLAATEDGKGSTLLPLSTVHKVLDEIDKEMLKKWHYSDEKKKAGSSWRRGDRGYRSNCDMFSDATWVNEQRMALQVVFEAESPEEESEKQAKKRNDAISAMYQLFSGVKSNTSNKLKKKKLDEDAIRDELWNDDEDDHRDFTVMLLEVRERGETSKRLARALLDMSRLGCAPFGNLRLSIAPWFAKGKNNRNIKLLKKTFQEKVEEAIKVEKAISTQRKKRLKTD